tara:strand:- start:79 stop:222 length:144 start_codon:yes stop_codon:yes gene_type:complete
MIDSEDNITNNRQLAKEIVKQMKEYENKSTFLGWDMVLKKFTLKKFK